MLTIWICAALAQCLLLFGLWRGARKIIKQQIPDDAPQVTDKNFPSPPPTVAMFIPVAGKRTGMEKSLRSLLEQDYPGIIPVMITGSADDPAVEIIAGLREDFPRLKHVVAGKSSTCGQKNHNTLQGIAAFGAEAEIYLFCDSTHEAGTDFARQLIWPILAGETAITTGYHNVLANDAQTVTLAYQISVLIMRFFQAISAFTQPWGGAMAIKRQTFERYDIANLWAENVVDDCSLAGKLLAMPLRLKLHARLCTRAILTTPAANHKLDVWRAWMDRQVLFLKFCVFDQWILLGFFAFLMYLPPLASLFVLLTALSGPLPAWAGAAAFAHLAALNATASAWREFGQEKKPLWPWLKAFWLAMHTFFTVYLRSIPAKGITWHGVNYTVGRGGKVISKG